MFMQRTRFYPASGKAADMEEVLAEATRSGQGKGRRLGLSRRIFSSEGPGLTLTLLADDLAAVERIRQENQADAAFRELAAKIAALSREPVRQALFERVGAGASRTGTTTVASFAVTMPAPGKDAQVVSILDEYVKAGQAAGLAVALWRRIYSSDGATIAVMARYADLADLDRVRKERQAATRAAVAAVGDLSRGPVQQRLLETVVAMPSA